MPRTGLIPGSHRRWLSCNIGLTPVIDPNNKALTRSRLSHVDQNYLRADTISTANAALIATQSRIEPAQMWGGGLLASVDGLRFVATDNASYSDMAFGLYKMLGSASPRASATSQTNGSGGPTCRAARRRPPGTGRSRPWLATG